MPKQYRKARDPFINQSDIGFLDTSSSDVTEDEILEYLARILTNIYLNKIHPERFRDDTLDEEKKSAG